MKTSNKIVVIGSSNTDMVVNTARFPAAGETILGGNFLMNAGGKGANQAVAAARLGGNVTFACSLGDDIFGESALKSFIAEGIDTSLVVIDDVEPSGVALITVDANAENVIVVASGANAKLSSSHVAKAEQQIANAAYLLMQLETPLETVIFAAEMASAKGVKVVLNPAPAQKLPEELFQCIAIITPNEKEAEMLTGIPVVDPATAKLAASTLHKKGVDTVVITLGAKGALVLHDGTFTMVNAVPVKAVDTTAAGDVFNGALVVALSEGLPMIAAVEFACKAASIAVTRPGAQASVPYRSEIEAS